MVTNSNIEVSANDVSALFAQDNPTLGQPNAPTTLGLVKLAEAGAQVWNAWRDAWPDQIVDFTECDLRPYALDFSGFRFGSKARFDCARFGNQARFRGAVFGGDASFRRVAFGNNATFTAARFEGDVSFDEANFDLAADDLPTKNSVAEFSSCQFLGSTSFRDARLAEHTWFNAAQFVGFASFSGATFGSMALFVGAAFGDSTSFAGATFAGTAAFSARSPEAVQSIWRRTCEDAAEIQQRIECAAEYGLKGSQFSNVGFEGSNFAGSAVFRDREFLGETGFGPLQGKNTVLRTRFARAPNFHGCKLHPDTSFDEVSFPPGPGTASDARAYRTLKTAMAQQQNTRYEQKFFRLELAAEAATAEPAQRPLYWLYRVASDFGFSLTRPLVAWLIVLVSISTLHGALAGTSALATELDVHRTSMWLQYVLANAVPLPGFDTMQNTLRPRLFPQSAGVLLAVMLLDIAHKTLAVVCVFLFGLALRNLFRMKA